MCLPGGTETARKITSAFRISRDLPSTVARHHGCQTSLRSRVPMWSKKGERRAHFAETTIDNVGAMLAEPSTISPASPGSPEGCRTCSHALRLGRRIDRRRRLGHRGRLPLAFRHLGGARMRMSRCRNLVSVAAPQGLSGCGPGDQTMQCRVISARLLGTPQESYGELGRV